MDKASYFQELEKELSSFPAEDKSRILSDVHALFSKANLEGKSDEDILQSLKSPQIIAAQKRAEQHYQELKNNFGFGRFLAFMLSLAGLAFLNFIMFIPAIIYAMFLGLGYLFSVFLYGIGIVMISASLSNVSEMQTQITNYRGNHIVEPQSIKIQINSQGIHKDKVAIGRTSMLDEDMKVESRKRKVVHQVHIKNYLSVRHLPLSIGVMTLGILSLLLCICLTYYSFMGLRKYLGWNWVLMKAPLQST